MSSAYSDRIIIPNKHDYTYHDKKESKTYYFYNAIKIKIDSDSYQTLEHQECGNDEWNVKVGDVVAIQADADDDDDDNGNEDKVDDFTPFAKNWWPVQIISIWTEDEEDGSDDDDDDDDDRVSYDDDENERIINMECRWYYRPGKDCKIDLEEDTDTDTILDKLYESNHVGQIEALSLLGPIRIFSDEDDFYSKELQESTSITSLSLPTKDFMCNKFYHTKKNKIDYKIIDFSIEERRKRGVRYSNHNTYKKWELNVMKKSKNSTDHDTPYSSSTNTAVKKKRKNQTNHVPVSRRSRRKRGRKIPKKTIELQEENSINANSQTDISTFSDVNPHYDINNTQIIQEEKDEEALVTTKENYFYKNKSTNDIYFKSITIPPSFNSFRYIDNIPNDNDRTWTIKIGDTVAIHAAISKCIKFPFNVPWCLAEIITIKSNDDTDANDNDDDDENQVKKYKKNNIQLEFRWIYKRDDLPQSVKMALPILPEDSVDEVFESDHIDTCDASSLLSPIQIFSNTDDYESFMHNSSENDNFFPNINYICSRKIWSSLRGTFMPCGDLISRIDRGRMHSIELKRDPSLRFALKQSNVVSSTTFIDEDMSSKSKWIQRYSNAISRLTLCSASYDASLVLDTLPCRENKINLIKSYLKLHLMKDYQSSSSSSSTVPTQADSNDSIYTDKDASCPNFFIAGPPGTGKTASVLHVIHQLQIESSRNGSLPSFDFVNINGMTISHPSDVYILLWKAISSQKLNHDNAFHNLDNFFADRQNITQQRKHNNKACKTIVLLLDEIDYLMTSKQEVLYNLFEWPVRTQRSSDSDAVVNGNRLIVIGISNTINLPQLLTSRVRSRLGGDKCLFSAYKQEEISIILQQHLSSIDDDESHDDRTNINDKKNFSVFHRDAIRFASKKVASMSGDLRNAFQLCRSAAEMVLSEIESGDRRIGDSTQNDDDILVSTMDINAAASESLQSPFDFIVANAASYEVLVIVCVAALKKSTGRDEGWFGLKEILTKMEAFSGALGDPEYLPPLTFDDLSGILSRLNECGLFAFNTPNTPSIALAAAGYCLGKWPRTLVQLQMQEMDVYKALRDTSHKRLVQRFLSPAGNRNIFT